MATATTSTESAASSSYSVFRDKLIGFAQWCHPGYETSRHHRLLAAALEEVESGKVKRLVITLPPQKGKPVYNGTMVLMSTGKRKPIAEIKVGECVITHEGTSGKVSAVVPQGDLDCVRIKTVGGREVIAALDHPFWTAGGWVNAGNLEAGMTLACVEPKCGGWDCGLTRSEARLLGYFVGDGSLTGSATGSAFNCSITSGEKSQTERILSAIAECGFVANVTSTGSVDKISVSGGSRDWIRKHGLDHKTSHTKRVPEAVFTSPASVIAEFLAGYFEADGTVSGRGKGRDETYRTDGCVEFYSVHRDLLADAQHLLLRFGIQSRLRAKRGRYKGEVHHSWRLTMQSQDAVARFTAAIPVEGLKAERLASVAAVRQAFDSDYLPDPIAEVERCGHHPCSCITVEGAHTYTVNDVVCHNSLLTSILFPAWYLAKNPNKRIILTGYGADVAERYSRGARDVVLSDRFKNVFPERGLSPDAQSVAFWQMQGCDGYIRATGVGGPITSFGADLLIIDDPHKDRQEADSEIARKAVWEWYTSVALTRLSPEGAIIVVQTRWTEADLTGMVLAQNREKWKVLHFPAVYPDGSPLWPERWTAEAYAEVKDEVGERDWNALYQGKPVPSEGGLFKRQWFKISETCPRLKFWIRYWDLAASTKEHGDYTVGAKVGVDEHGCLWVADVVRYRAEWPESRRRILETVALDGPNTHVGIEKAGMQLVAIQDLKQNDAFLKIPLHEVRPDKDKYSRAMAWAARAADGRLSLVAGPWNNALIDEACMFPHGTHDDIVDALSGAVSLLATMRGETLKEEQPPNPNSWEYFDKLSGYSEEEDYG